MQALLRLLMAAWLLFILVWGTLHGWIVPRIDEFLPQIEAQASRVLGRSVRIGSASAETIGWHPTFEFRDVRIHDERGEVALQLGRVQASISPVSIWTLSFEQLVVDAPMLEVRKRLDNTFEIAGMAWGASPSGDDDGAGADWLFSQSEFAIRGGTVRYRDDRRADAELEISQVQLVLRNRGLRHAVRLDGSLPQALGGAFTARGVFRQPMLSARDGDWRNWDGQVHVSSEALDLAALDGFVGLGQGQLASGRGALRAWLDVVRGEITGGVLDVAMAGVDLRIPGAADAMALRQVQTRLQLRELAAGFEMSTVGLAFETRSGVRWPGGDVFLSVQRGEGRVPGRGELRTEAMDLAALAQIASALPLPTPLYQRLAVLQPRGRVTSFVLHWDGNIEHPHAYRAKGQVQKLALESQPATPTPEFEHPWGVPGVRGLDADFEFTQAAGRAQLTIKDGAVDLPGVFEESTLPLQELTGQLSWTLDGDRIQVSMPNLRFANADAQGQAQLSWRTADPKTSPSNQLWPGIIDLSGTLSRGQGTRVHRYLPQVVPPFTRQYVREAVTAGEITSAQFVVRGDIWEFPFRRAGSGDFRIAAQVRNATYAYVPASLTRDPDLPWPTLTQVNGELVIDRVSLQVNQAGGRLEQTPTLAFSKADARIADLRAPVVAVGVELRGPAADMLTAVRHSPITELMNRALDDTVANGPAELQLRLQLPLAQLDRSRVQATLNLPGNDLRITPDSPVLLRSRGQVAITETGFSLSNASARLYGGDARIEGGNRSTLGAAPWAAAAPSDAALVFRAQGQASAEGLRGAAELGFLARLAASAQGAAAYEALLAIRPNGLDVNVQSDLRGLALDLPAPLGKPADSAVPLRYDNRVLAPGRDQLDIELADIGSIQFERDTRGALPQVQRGSIALGLAPGETVLTPARGVAANVRLGLLDIDAWEAALSRASGANLGQVAVAGDNLRAATSANNAPDPTRETQRAAQSYLPTALAVRAGELVVGGRRLHDVVVGGAREGLLWRANVDARELNGYVEFRQGAAAGAGGGTNTPEAAGRLYARLARLTVDPGNDAAVESLLDEEPRNVPALDIVVENFLLRGRPMGRLAVDAMNVGGERGAQVREWRLNRLALAAPDSVFTANGRWAAAPGQSRRRTSLDFRLDIGDGGQLLTRFGMPDVVKGAKGAMVGQITWDGSPLGLDLSTLNGQFNVDLAQGQFLKADPGIAKLLGVLSLQSLPRRLALDFRDVFSEGFVFDFVRGDARIEQGIASTNNLQMKGVNAAVLMEGQADIARETQMLKVVVIPEINAGTASLVATVINPAIGLGTFLAQMFLRRPLIEAATQEFRIDGTWSDPRITRVARSAPSGEAPPAEPAAPAAGASAPGAPGGSAPKTP